LCKDFLRDTRQRPVHVAGFFYFGTLPWRISNKERRMTKMPFNIHYSLFLVHYSQSGLLLVTSRRILFSVRCVAHLCVPFAIQQQKTSNYFAGIRRDDRIRTCDPVVPNHVFYRAELPPVPLLKGRQR